jgi:hypothetical protein
MGRRSNHAKKASDRNCSVIRIGKQPIGAICDAAQILAAADLTCGRRAWGYSACAPSRDRVCPAGTSAIAVAVSGTRVLYQIPDSLTHAGRRPIFSVPFARPKEKAPGSCCPPATARPWPCISKKSRLRSRQALMRSFFSIRQDGMSQKNCLFPATLPSPRCRQSHPN